MRKSIPVHLTYEVIRRDNCTCQYCGRQGEFIMRYGKPAVVENPKGIALRNMDYYNGMDVIPFNIDHIIPIALGGQNIKQNLVLSCRHCNLSKGAKVWPDRKSRQSITFPTMLTLLTGTR